MREYLIACLEKRKITAFLLYVKRNAEEVVT